MMAVQERVIRIRGLDHRQRCDAPPIPKSAKVELSSGCDLRCSFCASSLRPRGHAAMSVETYTRTIRELRSLGVEQLGLFYINEPFLYEWLPEAIRIAKHDCGYPYVFLTSNGLRATRQRVRSSIEAGLDSLKFALNFSSPAQFAATTGASEVAYSAILDNIAAARQVRDEIAGTTGQHCRLSVSSLEYDASQRERMAMTLAEIEPYVDEHYWLPLFGRRERAPRDTSPDSGDARDGLLRKQIPCWSLFTEAHIAADGELSACCLDHSSRFAMGNLAHTSFEQAWHGKPFRTLRQAHLNGDVSATVCARCIGYD
jgi:hypothetical protein